MNALYKAFSVALMRSLPARRNLIAYTLVFTYPAMFIVLFYLVGGEGMTKQVLLGIPIVYLFNNGIVALPQQIVEYKFRHLQHMFVASPIHPLTYMLGMALSRLLYVLPVVLVVTALLVGLDFFPGSGLFTYVVVLTGSWLTGCAIGFTVATYIDDFAKISAVANFLGMLVVILPPVLYPIDLLPPPWGMFTLAIPAVSAAHILRVLANETAMQSQAILVLSYCSVFAWAACAFVIVALKVRWREP